MLKFEVLEKFDENCSKIFDTLKHNSNYNFFKVMIFLKFSSRKQSEIKIIAILKMKN